MSSSERKGVRLGRLSCTRLASDAPQPVSWGTLAATAAVGGLAALAYQYAWQRKEAGDAAVQKVESFGTPLLGGPFSLVDQDGRPVTDADFRGEYMLVYFGFTYCPDICPSELVKMDRIVSAVGAPRLLAGAACSRSSPLAGSRQDARSSNPTYLHLGRPAAGLGVTAQVLRPRCAAGVPRAAGWLGRPPDPSPLSLRSRTVPTLSPPARP